MPGKLSDVLDIQATWTSLSLTELEPLRAALDAEVSGFTLGTQRQLTELLGGYLAQDDEAEEALRVLLPPFLSAGGSGTAALVEGPARSGKTHLLSVLALLGEYPAVWPLFLQTHPQFTTLHQSLRSTGGLLVVPVPLQEHRGQEERLEDIVFDRAERELARGRYNLRLPLSRESYALDLIERHVLPRYREELDEQVRQHVGGFTHWEQLRQRRPQEAVSVAQSVGRQVGYPLDFRQSRSERLWRLLQILPQAGRSGVIWLLDDLGGFLAAAGAKAGHDDCAFLEFLGQRARLEPVSVMAVIQEGLEEVGLAEPYLLSNLRSLYITRVPLTAGPVRKVAHAALRFTDGDRGRRALAEEAAEVYEAAFGELSVSREELARSYPLHPLTEKCLEALGQRFLGQADTVLQFFAAPLGRGGLRDLRDRPAVRLVSPGDLAAFLEPLLLGNAQAAPYFREALDYYRRNAGQLLAEDPELGLELVQCLLVLRLAGITATVKLLRELLGPAEGGPARIKQPALVDMLETLRLLGSYVDVRRGLEPDSAIYLLDVQTNLTELVRQRLGTVKQGLAADDPRLWRRVLAAADSPSFPLSELIRPQPFELTWENSLRGVQVQVANFSTLRTAEAAAFCQEASDPDTPEDCYLLLGQIGGAQQQTAAWQVLAQDLPRTRWAAALLAWIPRELSAAELDTVRHCAACHELLRQPAPEGEMQAAWRGRLLEERMALDNAVRAIAQAAYYEGAVWRGEECVATPADLAVVKGDWTATVARLAQPALEHIYPDFPALAPEYPLTTREQIDLLMERVIAPLQAPAGAEDELDALVRGVLVPLKLAVLREGRWQVSAAGPAAEEVMARIRQRDQAEEHEQGRLLSCADLAAHVLKSPLGLPPELFELTLGVLVRAGHLVAFDHEQRALPSLPLPVPFAREVECVARPALLPFSGWQVLSRVSRVVLQRAVTSPGYGEQQGIWEALLAEREARLERLGTLRERLLAVAAQLGQGEDKWRESLADLAAAREFFAHLDPALPAGEGLARFVAWLEPHLQEGRGVSLLSNMLRAVDQLGQFLERGAAEVLSARQYLEDPHLVTGDLPELETRRQALLELIAEGEALTADEAGFHRQVQAFLTTYQRRYVAWHSRVHRDTAFEHYRAVKGTPEYRALAQLQPLDLDVRHDLMHVGETIDHYLSLRCGNPELGANLARQAVCSRCGLRLGEELNLPSAEQLMEPIREGLREYFLVLTRPELRELVGEYAHALPHRRELVARLEAVAALEQQPAPREVMQLFTDEVISHLKRIVEGKTVLPRNLGELQRALSGRTLTREQAERLFAQWMGTGGGEEEDLFLIEP